MACGVAGAKPPLTAEFDSPYQFRLLSGGTILEVSGSFSWALPQSFEATLASAPAVKMISFDSPGGHLQPALQVAEIIHDRALATYVGRFCASACTVAFLGGQQRWLAPDARLGFHQARAPGVATVEADAYLREAYEKFALPSSFIAHVLRTPPEALWFPTSAELRAAHVTTGDPPPAVVAHESSMSLSLSDFMPLIRAAPDSAVVQIAMALSDLLARLQDRNPEACWSFAHQGTADLKNLVPPAVLDAMSAAAKQAADEASTNPTAVLDSSQRKSAAADLIQSMRAAGQGAALDDLLPGADHAAFCTAMRSLLRLALALPEPRRVNALRVVLSGG